MPMPKLTWATIASKLYVTRDGCLEYPSKRHGYSTAGHSSRGLHRELYESWIKRKLGRFEYIDHMCRNRGCVNIMHLRIVTPRINAIENSDGITAQQARKTCCPKCGADYTVNRQGYRICPPCMTAGRADRYLKRTEGKVCRRNFKTRRSL